MFTKKPKCEKEQLMDNLGKAHENYPGLKDLSHDWPTWSCRKEPENELGGVGRMTLPTQGGMFRPTRPIWAQDRGRETDKEERWAWKCPSEALIDWGRGHPNWIRVLPQDWLCCELVGICHDRTLDKTAGRWEQIPAPGSTSALGAGRIQNSPFRWNFHYVQAQRWFWESCP